MTGIDEFGTHYDRLWAVFRSDVTFGTNRSASYMNWRYVRHPYFQYQRRLFESPAGAAYIVWREEPVTGHEKCVARVCEAIGSPAALADAVPVLYQHLADRPVAFADFFGAHASVLAGLRAGGMRPVITVPPFDLPRLFSPLAPDVRKTLNFAISLSADCPAIDLYAHDKMYLTKGDTNQDRPNL